MDPGDTSNKRTINLHKTRWTDEL